MTRKVDNKVFAWIALLWLWAELAVGVFTNWGGLI